MNKLHLVFALLFAAAAPVFAGPCVVLEYQEMKDMSTNDLVQEACKVRQAIGENIDDGIANLGSRPGSEPHPNSHDNLQQCVGQGSRIERVLAVRGVAKESLKDLCTQQAAGQTIKASAEIK